MGGARNLALVVPPLPNHNPRKSIMKMLKIGLAQVRQTASFEENVKTVFRFIDEAAKAKVQILSFPETHVVGYRVDITPTDQLVEPDRLDEVNRKVAKRCGELGMRSEEHTSE